MSEARRLDLRALAVAAPLTGAVVWFATAVLPWPARLGVVLLLVVLPSLMLLQTAALRGRDLADVARARGAVYASSAIAIWVMGGLALGAALASGYTWSLLGLQVPGGLELAGWTVMALAGGVGIVAIAKLAGASEAALLQLVVPQTGREKLAYVGLCLSAGVGEELAFRSFLVPALGAASGSVWAGAGLAAGAFGMVHAHQGAAGALRAAALGFVLSVPLVLAGTVVPGMIAHAALDLVAGLWLADWLLGGG